MYRFNMDLLENRSRCAGVARREAKSMKSCGNIGQRYQRESHRSARKSLTCLFVYVRVKPQHNREVGLCGIATTHTTVERKMAQWSSLHNLFLSHVFKSKLFPSKIRKISGIIN